MPDQPPPEDGTPDDRSAGESQGDQPRLDVDARFLLANERTLLAWLRTALTLLAGAVAVLQFGDRLALDLTLTVVLLGLGAGSAVLGARRFVAADQAIREHRLPDRGRAPLALAGAVLLLAAGLLVAVLVSAGR